MTQHLPCIVAFDGVPHPELPWLCIPLRNEHLSVIFRTIQAALGALQSHPGLRHYRKAIRELSSLPKRLEHDTNEEREMHSQPARIRRQVDLLRKEISGSYTDGLRRCREAIEFGQQKHFARLLGTLAKRFPELHLDVLALSDVPWNMLTHFRKTTHMMGRYATLPWPLPADALARLSNIYTNHARVLAVDLPAQLDWQSQAQVQQICDRLMELWRIQVEERMGRFPQPTKIMNVHWQAQQEKLQALCGEVASLEAREVSRSEAIRRTEQNLIDTSHRILDLFDRPSFCELLQSECYRAAIPSVPEPAPRTGSCRHSSFWTSWLSVSSMLKLLCERSFQSVPSLIQSLGGSVNVPFWRHPPSAFASYASADRSEVLRRIQGMSAWQPALDIFVDFHSLFPGERWKARLEEEIMRRDRFFLFWSRAARASTYVDSEWRTALRCRGLSSITPVPLEPPDVAEPPPELADLHFGDFYVEMLRFKNTSHVAAAEE